MIPLLLGSTSAFEGPGGHKRGHIRASRPRAGRHAAAACRARGTRQEPPARRFVLVAPDVSALVWRRSVVISERAGAHLSAPRRLLSSGCAASRRVAVGHKRALGDPAGL